LLSEFALTAITSSMQPKAAKPSTQYAVLSRSAPRRIYGLSLASEEGRLRNSSVRGSPLSDVTPHVLRHSFASIANDLGFTEVTIAALVGHAKGSVTSASELP
jgi:integrase